MVNSSLPEQKHRAYSTGIYESSLHKSIKQCGKKKFKKVKDCGVSLSCDIQLTQRDAYAWTGAHTAVSASETFSQLLPIGVYIIPADDKAFISVKVFCMILK